MQNPIPNIPNPIVYKVTTWDRRSIMARGAYRLTYLKGTKVIAPMHSVGCMCFESLKTAEDFAFHYFSRTFGFLRVEGIGKAIVMPDIALWYSEADLSNFYTNDHVHGGNAPRGTVCYPEILMLD